MNALARWMKKASPEQQRRLARRARTTLGTLRQIAGSYRTGGRPSVNASLAIRIDRATHALANTEPVIPKPITREALCAACRGCEFAKHYRS